MKGNPVSKLRGIHKFIMILGVGVDIIQISRLEKSVESAGRRFLERVFTGDEIAYCQRKRNPYPSLAARFAAKEAFIKALPHEATVSLREIEVFITAAGKPAIRAKGKAARLVEDNGISSAHVSLSHEKEYAVAHVVLEGRDAGEGELCNPLFTDGCRTEP
jgi:holo-[acyl-carrier protein] synthase